MSSNIRRVSTPRVKKTSKRYRLDAARMKMFYDYEDYLDYEEDVKLWLDAETNNNVDDEFSTKARTAISRRKITARRHRQSVNTATILLHRADKNSQERRETGYKRATILQSQCVELEDIPLVLDDKESCVSVGFDVSSLRIVERSVKNVPSILCKAKAYGKRTSCLYGKKKQDIKKTSNTNAIVSTTSGDTVDEPMNKVSHGYFNRKVNVPRAINPHMDSVKESKIGISRISCLIVPKFF